MVSGQALFRVHFAALDCPCPTTSDLRPPRSKLLFQTSRGVQQHYATQFNNFFHVPFALRFQPAAPGQVHIVIHPGNNYCVHINIEAEEAKRVYRLAAMAGIMMPSKLNGKWMGL